MSFFQGKKVKKSHQTNDFWIFGVLFLSLDRVMAFFFDQNEFMFPCFTNLQMKNVWGFPYMPQPAMKSPKFEP